jgi:LDH2 family malate/lactate/ureidoglycolate dehydrogenase
MSTRYPVSTLRGFASRLLVRAGLAEERADAVADILVEGDLMGHTTHGLQLLGPYLKALGDGTMRRAGDPKVIADRGAAATWDGGFLPGPWLVLRAMELAFARVAERAVVTVAIRRSSHIGCLAAYLKRATDRGLVILLTCSDPSVVSVAPFGATAARYTPNPLAAGFPTDGLPVLIDISASTTTNGLVGRMNRAGKGERLPGPWLVDSSGRATDDPAVVAADPPGAILPLGGMDLGHKGFALGLLVEALTSALTGHGRADGESRWGASIFLQVIDPAAFGGREAFVRESGWLANACRTAPVASGNPPVRIPGERALKLREEQLAEGVALDPEIMPSLKPWAEKLGVARP